jgi:uncharacterized protein (DUF885 family)
MIRHFRLCLTTTLLICTSLFSFAQQANEWLVQTSEVHHLLINYAADEGSLSRFYTIVNSPERRERFLRFQMDYLKRLQELRFESLSMDGKVDYLLFKRNIETRITLLKEEEKEYEQIKKFTLFADSLYALERRRRRGTYPESDRIAGTLNNIHKETLAATKKLALGKNIHASLAGRAEQTIRGQQLALRSVFNFYAGYNPEFTWWVTAPHKKLDSALSTYAKALKAKADNSTLPKDDGSGIIGRPIGRDELIRQLKHEMIPYTPEELVEVANKEFAWCDREMLKASADLGFGSDWKRALEKVKQTYVPEGRQPEVILDLLNQSVDFIKKNDLLTIPPIAEETWRMSMMSAAQQRVSPFFLGGELIQISYPTSEMEHEEKLMSMRGNNPHFSRATVHHELIGGHHLQRFMNNRYKDYRDFNTPFWTEGWALYWEMILWDMNFPRSPEDRVGMLFWRMHRCARIIFSLNYHLGRWTPQQCIDFLVDRVGHERANAEGEVRRSFTGNYGPLYQLAYMMGALQFYALKNELVGSGKMTYKQFHDAVLKLNNIPVELVRATLINQPLTHDFVTQWRFYSVESVPPGNTKK